MLPARAFDKRLLQESLVSVILGLDFLHQIGVVHTGKSVLSFLSLSLSLTVI